MNSRKEEITKILERLKREGCEVEDLNNGHQFRINGNLDVYPKSGRIFYLPTKEWISTTPEDINTTIDHLAW